MKTCLKLLAMATLLIVVFAFFEGKAYTQSGTTKISINCATSSCVDIGASINTAEASLPSSGGQIVISGGNPPYIETTPIVLTSGVSLKCTPGYHGTSIMSGPSVIDYIPTSGVAMTANGSGIIIDGCSFFGPGKFTSTVGLIYGGSNGATSSRFLNGGIQNFGVGYQPGNNSYLDTFQNFVIANNSRDLYVPTGMRQGNNENVQFSNGVIGNDDGSPMTATCIDVEGDGVEWNFTSVSVDDCGITMNNLNDFLNFNTPHFEQSSGLASTVPFITLGANSEYSGVYVSGGQWRESTTGAGRTDFVEDDSATSSTQNSIVIHGGILIPGEAVPQVVLVNHPCCDLVSVANITNGEGGFRFASMIGGSPFNGGSAVLPGFVEMFKMSAPAGRVNWGQQWFDSADLRWKMNNNDGGATMIVGDTTADTLSNKTLQSPNFIGAPTFNGKALAASSTVCTDINAVPTTSGCENGPHHSNTGILSGGSCTTAAHAFAQCKALVNFAYPEPDTNYAISCTGIGPTGWPYIMGIAIKDTSSVTVQIGNGSGPAAVPSSFSEVDCTIAR